jgi:hypothetical protein
MLITFSCVISITFLMIFNLIVDFDVWLHLQMWILSWSSWKASWFCKGNGRFYSCQLKVWISFSLFGQGGFELYQVIVDYCIERITWFDVRNLSDLPNPCSSNHGIVFGFSSLLPFWSQIKHFTDHCLILSLKLKS